MKKTNHVVTTVISMPLCNFTSNFTPATHPSSWRTMT